MVGADGYGGLRAVGLDVKRGKNVRHEASSGFENPDVNYRVTWTTEGGGETPERIFTGWDHGWEFYQDMQKSTRAYNVTWEHIPA